MGKLDWLKEDKFVLGLLIGLIIPVPFALFFGAVLRLVQKSFNILGNVRDVDILLLGIGVNLLILRYYLINVRAENTAKGVLLLTVIMILSFFLFLKNTNFAVPF